MDLNKLSAQELARLDAICLEFESKLRSRKSVSIDKIVREHGGKNAKILRAELQAIALEVSKAVDAPTPFADEGGEESLADQLDSVRQDVGEHVETRGEKRSTEQPVTIDSLGQSRVDTGVSDPALQGTRIEETPFPKPGTRLGPYQLGEEIGQGGMGVVFRATDTRLKREVAVKVLSVTGRKRKELTQRFEREARAVAALSHPNIVELFDVGVSGQVPYAVMEFLNGKTLTEHLESTNWSPREIRDVGAQIADALVTAHAGGVIHRDLKPHNIILHSGGDHQLRVKLLDFGLSRELRDDGELASDDFTKTREGTILGTPGYMSPEQARGEPATSAADIFGLGCILYEAFYCKPAIDGATVAERFAATLAQPPLPDPIRRRDDVSLADLIQQCVSAEPSDRPDASTVLETLRQPLLQRAHGPLESTSGRRSFLAAFAGGIVGTVGIAYWLTSDGGDLDSIDSFAVLSFDDLTSVLDSETDGRPIGDREMTRGEEISATLVNELSRIEQLKVLPFVPLRAETPEQFKKVGRRLGVDALITGSLREREGESADQIELTLKIISVANGTQLWSETLTRQASDRFLQHSTLASEIASRIGLRLVAAAERQSPPQAKRYNCFVDGRARANVDSIPGMKMALKCFELAHKAAPRDVDPLAAMAVTALTLAARSQPPEAETYMATALEKLGSALDIDRSAVEVQLAEAMIEWQKLRHYEKSAEILKRLTDQHPYQWMLRHQYGLLLTTMGRNTEAREHLNTAVLLNPMSALLKTDLARLEWFNGHDMTVVSIAKRAKEELNVNQLPVGLLVDVYEQQARYDEASEQLGWNETPANATDYFERRADTLSEIPYGPFGSVLNALILQLRRGESVDENRLAQFGESPLPMFPLLLSRHPALAQARLLPAAQQYLPAKS